MKNTILETLIALILHIDFDQTFQKHKSIEPKF